MFHTNGNIQFVRVRKWPFRIGRHPKSDLCLPDSTTVSRRQAVIDRRGEAYALHATGRNPTYINGDLVPRDDWRDIQAGDIVEVPGYTLVVRDMENLGPANAETTAQIQTTTASSVLVRQIAAAIGVSQWTFEGIHEWLKGHSRREVTIRHGNLAFKLASRLDVTDVRQRIELFDDVIPLFDPKSVVVDVQDPLARVAKDG